MDADTAGLVSHRLSDGAARVISRAPDLDVENILLHPRTGVVQAVSYLADPRRWEAIDPAVGSDIGRLGRLRAGHVAILSRDRDDAKWIVSLSNDRPTRRVYLWERASRKATLLVEEHPELAKLPLPHVQPVTLAARDGLRVRGYLTLPLGVPPRRLPLVVWVHGGPYLRDAWGYDYTGQLFANRGYAFLRVNFRGSRGFGRRYRVSSFKQWGGTMRQDIEDAVAFVVGSGVADRSRVAIIGHSYGGYVVLAALTKTPGLYACGAASSTTANLLAFVERFPLVPDNAWVRETVGDHRNPGDAAMLRDSSPVTFVDRVTKPLLVVRGDRDDALPPGDIDAFVSSIAKRGGDVASVVYEGDGHFYRRENQLDYLARVEALFARCLGGRAEPMAGDKYPGSTARVISKSALKPYVPKTARFRGSSRSCLRFQRRERGWHSWSHVEERSKPTLDRFRFHRRQAEMRDFDVQTVELPVSFDEAFDYIADARTLPDWTHAFRSVSDLIEARRTSSCPSCSSRSLGSRWSRRPRSSRRRSASRRRSPTPRTGSIAPSTGMTPEPARRLQH
jgi:dienelactone hydrolase